MSNRRLVLCLFGLALAACELIVDFDSGGDAEGNIPPTPIPQLDGAVAVVVDAQAIADGTVVKVPNDGSVDAGDAGDAGGDRPDATLDATVGIDAAGAVADARADFMDGAIVVPEPSSDASLATSEDGGATAPDAAL